MLPLQHPFGQELALQTQPEPLQVSPPPHEKHPTPPDPQSALVFPGRQVVELSQHPAQFPLAMHSQIWFSQSRSALVQSTQVCPLLPQSWSVVPLLQAVPSQHPEEQEAALQSQDPLLQYCPPPQVVQVPPAAPQLAAVGGSTQVVPAQQPEQQEPPRQVPLPLSHGVPGLSLATPHAPLQVGCTQSPASVQARQLLPPEPHAAMLLFPGRHWEVEVLQQPVQQLPP